jgi:hypothetical protein
MKLRNSLELPSTKVSKAKVSRIACLDLSDVTFDVNDAIGSQSCATLLLNMDRFEYLCLFEDVAAICHDTCGMRGLDAP